MGEFVFVFRLKAISEKRKGVNEGDDKPQFKL